MHVVRLLRETDWDMVDTRNRDHMSLTTNWSVRRERNAGDSVWVSRFT